MRLYIVRHGDPDYQRDDLTQQGLAEAKALALLFAREGLDEVHTSTLGRARRTASFTAEALGLEAIEEPWSREIHELRDSASGLMVWDYDPILLASLSDSERLKLVSDDSWLSLPPFDHPELGTAIGRIQSGADVFLEKQGFVREAGYYRVTRPNKSRIALFCHNGSGLSLLSYLLRIPLPLLWSGFFMHTSSVTTLLFEERRPKMATARCLGFSDMSHLRLAGLPIGTSGLKANLD